MTVNQSKYRAVRVVVAAALALTALLALAPAGSAGEMAELPPGIVEPIDIGFPPPHELDLTSVVLIGPPQILYVDKACTADPETGRYVVSAHITDPNDDPEDLSVWIDGGTETEPRVRAPMTYVGADGHGLFSFTFDVTEFGRYEYGWIEASDPGGGSDFITWNCDPQR